MAKKKSARPQEPIRVGVVAAFRGHSLAQGAVSVDGDKALVIGYERSRSGSQNADDHHCLHSRPYFGDIAPGESVTRRGYVVFGDDIDKIAKDLKQRICG